MRVSVNPQAEQIQQLLPKCFSVLHTVLHPQPRHFLRVHQCLQMSRWSKATKWSSLSLQLNTPPHPLLHLTRNEAPLISKLKADVVCKLRWGKTAHKTHRKWFKDRGWRQLSCRMKMRIRSTPLELSGNEPGTKVLSNCIFCSCGAPHVCATSDIIVDYSC